LSRREGGAGEERDETAVRQDILCPGASQPQNSSPVDCSNMFILNHQRTEILTCVNMFGEMIAIDSYREFLKNRKILVPHYLHLNAKPFTCGV